MCLHWGQTLTLACAYLRLCDPDTQRSWLRSICLLVKVLGEREETESHMNADTLTIKMLSFPFLEFFSPQFLFFPFPGNVFNLSLPLSRSPHQPPPPLHAVKGTDGSLYASKSAPALQSSRLIRPLPFFFFFFFWQTHARGINPAQTH